MIKFHNPHLQGNQPKVCHRKKSTHQLRITTAENKRRKPNDSAPPVKTRSGWIVRKPTRYKDYV